MTHFERFSGSFALLGLLSWAGACSSPEGAPGVAALPAGEITVAIEPSVRVPLGGLAEIDVTLSDYGAELALTAAADTPGLVFVPSRIGKRDDVGTIRVGAEAPLAVGDTFTLRVVAREGTVEHTATARALVVDRAGALDPSFGEHGTFIAGGSKYSIDAFHDILTLPDGTLVAVGNRSTLGGELFQVAHLLPDGRLDPAWGSIGIGFPTYSFDATAYAVGRQSSGRLIVAGENRNHVGVAALLPSGEIATSFGTEGRRILDLPGESAVFALRVAPDDALILAGYHNRRSLVVRLLADGTLDPHFGVFGQPGVAESEFRHDVASQAHDVALDREGHILIVGEAGSRAYLTRGESTGVVDDTDLLPLPPGAEPAAAQKIAIQPDGRILVAGSLRSGGVSAVAVWRLLPIVSLRHEIDPSFGKGGIAVVPVPGSFRPLAGFALLPDGGMVVAANAMMNTNSSGGPPYDMTRPELVRLRADGTVEPGIDGAGTVPVGLGRGNVLYSIADAGNGEVLLGYSTGEGTEKGGNFAALARVWR